jgi:hypothetical protein
LAANRTLKLKPSHRHPGRKRQSVDGNVAAKVDAKEVAPAFFAEQHAVKR